MSQTKRAINAELDTFPKLLQLNAKRFAERHAAREKEYGIWQSWTWAALAEEIRDFACGLAAMGFGPEDKLAIIGDNRPQLYGAICATQALRGVPVPMYQDAVARELAFVMDHAGARFVIAENQEQVDKALELKDDCPKLEQIIYLDPRGLRHYKHDFLHSYKAVCERGREYQAANPGFWQASVDATRGEDTAIILYTSGTTGNPKGVVLTHNNVLITADNAAKRDGLNEHDDILAYLPMAWVGDNIFSFAQSYTTGFCVSCPESAATVMHDLNEIGPTFYFAPPRIFENLLTSVTIRMEDAGRVKRWLYRHFMKLAHRVGVKILNGETVSTLDRLRYRLGEVLVYGPLKNTLGFSRIRIAYTAGEAIGPEIFDFYRSIGVNIKQLYGQTEASVFITMQPDGEIKSDTVGTPAPDVEIKIADDGEVLYRSPGAFQCYYKNDEATAKTKTPEGWVHTGDAGYFDGDGHLKIIDRAKDVSRLKDGSILAPKFIENKLKFFPHIKEVVVFGQDRDYVSAFVNIDLEAVGSWAERNNIGYASYQELASNPQVIEQIQNSVEQVNADLSTDPKLSGSQIRRFLVLHKELDADDGELTRTQKVRRSFVADRYAPLIDALYSDAQRCDIETEVTFEDGRTGSLKANLEIRNVDAVAPLAKAS